MSDTQRICVCKKQRAKEPVIITITTCVKKHCKTKNAICVLPTSHTAEAHNITSPLPSVSPPIIQESEKNIDATKFQEDAVKTEQADKEATDEPASEVYDQGEAKPKSTEGVNEDEDDMSTALEINEMKALTNEMMPKHEFHKSEDFEKQPVGEVLEVKLNTESFQSPPPEKQPQEDPATAPENTIDAKNQGTTVLLVTKMGINSLPFLDRFFLTKDNPTSKLKSSEHEECNKNSASKLIVPEIYSDECRHNLNHLNQGNSVFDGKCLVGNWGRVSISTGHTDALIEPIKIPGDYIADSKQNVDEYQKMHKNQQTYFKTEQMLHTLTKKTSSFGNMQKYINVEKKDTDFSSTSMLKSSRDQSLQIGTTYIANKITSRWYDRFLMCFRLNREASLHDAVNSIGDTELTYFETEDLKI